MGEKEEGTGPYPRTCHSLSRHHGCTATRSTCRDTSCTLDPVMDAPDLGSRDTRMGIDPVRGPRWLFPYSAGSGRPVLAFFSAFFSPLWLLVPCCDQSRVLCRTRTGTAFPVLCSTTFSFFPLGHHLRVVGKTDFHLISIGHIIASETEEEIFRILGTSYRYICIFLVICED